MSRLMLLLLVVVLLIAAGAAWLIFRPSEPVIILPASERGIPESEYWSEADRWVDVDGLGTRVRIEGSLDASPIILIHGFSHSLESWDAWAADLASDHLVIRYDMPGHALTGPDPQQRYSVPQTVDHLAGLMDALQIDQAAIAGNSLGGLVAWRYAAEHPGRVSSLALLAPGGYSINGVTEEPVSVPMPVRFFMTQAPEPMIGAATQALFGDATRMDPDMPARVFALMREPGVGAALVERLEVFTLPDPTAELARVDIPVLIMWGESDSVVPPEHGAQFVADLPSAELRLYSGLGHVVHEEAPEETLNDLRAFLGAD